MPRHSGKRPSALGSSTFLSENRHSFDLDLGFG